MKSLTDQLDECVAYRAASFPGKLLRKPYRTAYTKSLQLFSQRFNVARPVKAETFWGDELQVVLPEPVSSAIFRIGYFEEGLTRMVLAHVKPGMVFLDVGAHFGYFSMLASTLVGPEGQVHAFEPTPSTYAVLRANAATRPHVKTYNTAAWSERTEIPFNDYGLRFSALNSFSQPRIADERRKHLGAQPEERRRTYQVQALPLDEFVDAEGIVPGFVKIDAESAEHEVLRGADQILRRHRPVVSIEVGDLDIEGAVPSSALIRELTEVGYAAYEFAEGRIQPHTVRAHYESENILFLPKA